MKRRLQIDRMKEIREVGRIRCGEKAISQGGKEYPRGRDTFRFTSSNKVLLNALQAIHGGTVKPWEGHQGQFELDSQCSQIQCFVAFDDISQVWEQWSAGGCTHRCDGVDCDRVVVKDTGKKDARNNPIFEVDEFEEACTCDGLEDRDKPCKLTTRVKMMLPDTRDIGMWRIESHGVIFGGETMALVKQLSQFGPVACILSLGWQEIKKPGKPGNKFVVPSLTLDPTPPNFAKVLVESTLASQVQRQLAGSNAPALEASNQDRIVSDVLNKPQPTKKQEPKPKAVKEEVEPTPMPEDWHESREESLAHGKAIAAKLNISGEQIEVVKEIAKEKNLPWHVVLVKAEMAGLDTYDDSLTFAQGMEAEPIQGVLVE